jgi:hypothetical protein
VVGDVDPRQLGQVEHAAKAIAAVERKAGQRAACAVEAQLQDVVGEDHRLGDILENVADRIAQELGHHGLVGHRQRTQQDPVEELLDAVHRAVEAVPRVLLGLDIDSRLGRFGRGRGSIGRGPGDRGRGAGSRRSRGGNLSGLASGGRQCFLRGLRQVAQRGKARGDLGAAERGEREGAGSGVQHRKAGQRVRGNERGMRIVRRRRGAASGTAKVSAAGAIVARSISSSWRRAGRDGRSGCGRRPFAAQWQNPTGAWRSG